MGSILKHTWKDLCLQLQKVYRRVLYGPTQNSYLLEDNHYMSYPHWSRPFSTPMWKVDFATQSVDPRQRPTVFSLLHLKFNLKSSNVYCNW